jgi:hypothetical protein
MAEASDHDLKNVTILVLMIILTSSSVQESTRRSHKWSPEPLNILRGSLLLNVSSAITQGPRLLRLPTGTSYPNTWVICTFFLCQKISEHLATGPCTHTALAPAIPLRRHSRTFVGSSVAVSMSQRNSRLSWTRLCTIARLFQISPPFIIFRI